jgi:L-lactate dehydrogenase complex protein LldG
MAGTSKEQIVGSLRSSRLEVVELPDLDQDWIQYDDPVGQFATAVQAVGGRAVMVDSDREIDVELEKIRAYGDAQNVCSLIPGVRKANVDLETVDDPHELEDVDFFIAPGHFGIAETGAVWVTDEPTKHRVLYFITQHLVLVVPASEIVSNMQQAYEWLAFNDARFGLFISGPSKTADIEQSLVIGAHGARSLTVVVVRSSS